MSIELIRLAPFNGVAANSLANLDLSQLLGFTVENIFLQLGGTFTKAQLTAIQLKANGKVIVDTDGARCDARMQFRGLTAAATLLCLDFSEYKARSKVAAYSGALDTTLGVRNLRLECQIGAATSPTLQAFASVSAPLVSPEFGGVRPLISRVHRVTQTIGAAGTFPLAVPHLDPVAGGSIFKRIAVHSANMTGALVTRNGVNVHESIKAINDYRQQYQGGRTPQAGVYMLDFIVDNIQEDAVLDTRPASGCSTAAVFGTFSAGETITIESEVLEPLDVY
ncbi:MAG TPA: major capsid protein P2 [Burkholderiaceae bacterium]|nr:major capsid protein P2 [Burkholderiaceae bacterium]